MEKVIDEKYWKKVLQIRASKTKKKKTIAEQLASPPSNVRAIDTDGDSMASNLQRSGSMQGTPLGRPPKGGHQMAPDQAMPLAWSSRGPAKQKELLEECQTA